MTIAKILVYFRMIGRAKRVELQVSRSNAPVGAFSLGMTRARGKVLIDYILSDELGNVEDLNPMLLKVPGRNISDNPLR